MNPTLSQQQWQCHKQENVVYIVLFVYFCSHRWVDHHLSSFHGLTTLLNIVCHITVATDEMHYPLANCAHILCLVSLNNQQVSMNANWCNYFLHGGIWYHTSVFMSDIILLAVICMYFIPLHHGQNVFF